MDMLWSFVKSHLRTKTLVFLSSCKEVKFVHEVFMRLRPGVPVSCLHGRMKQTQRTITGATMDCPEDVASYIHRVGRTARYTASGRSLLFLTPSEEVMLEDLKTAKIPVKVIKKNKGIFDVKALPIAEYAVSLGLPTTPRVRFIKSGNEKKNRVKQKTSDISEDDVSEEEEEEEEEDIEYQEKTVTKENLKDSVDSEAKAIVVKEKKSKLDQEEFLSKKRPRPETEEESDQKAPVLMKNSGVKVLKKKKLKIDPGKARSQRMVFDEEGNALPPLAAFATKDDASTGVDEQVAQAAGEHFLRIKEEMRKWDKEDRLMEKQRLREKRFKNKMKLKAAAEETKGECVQLLANSDSDGEDESMDERPTKKRGSRDVDVSDQEGAGGNTPSDSDEDKPAKQQKPFTKLSTAEQDLALKLLQSRKSTF
ncbi:hypothetical protein R1flu_009440 [Riccia fluitans]|uniref:ATP-dependent RNA helicase n=1 Tax=Riccia fluitans TaxID=41844 RepID=A0ABD1Z2W6_9MARC